MRKCLFIFILLMGLSPTTHAQSVEKPDLTWLLQTNQAKSLRYWFDTETKVTETDGISNHYTIDASSLLDGLHTIHFQIVDTKGIVGNIASKIFFKIQEDEEAEAITIVKVIYWYDNETNINELDIQGGGQLIDVSHLEEGVHTIHCQAICSNGQITPVASSIFVYANVVDIENRITKYNYWINDNTTDKKTVELVNAPNPYQLLDLLPIREEPIRSTSFHFEIVDNQPMIYAKNDFHVRFHDLRGYFLDESKPFIDYRVGRPIEITEWLVSGENKTIDKPEENDVKWYQLEAELGDSVQFRLDRAATVQLFAPSGEEVFSTSGAESVKWFGCHVRESGTYYLALHDVTATQGTTVILDYNHIDKYAVLRQDVTLVGNGGCSTITFEGNGFRNLLAVDLYTAAGDSIHSVDISHDSDAETAVTFDFSDAELGVYDAVFHFIDEDKCVSEVVTVEEVKEIDIETEVQYASSYLRGTKNPYRITLTNVGNMTAYDVPVIIGAFEENDGALNYIKVNGYSLSKVYDEVWKDSLPTALYDSLRHSTLEHGDMCYFINNNNSMYEQGFPFAKFTSLFPSIPPCSSLHLTVSIKSSQSTIIYVWVANPNQANPTPTAQHAREMLKIQCDYYKRIYAKCIENKKKQFAKEAESQAAEGACNLPSSCDDHHGGKTKPQPPADPNDIYGYLSEAGSKFIADSVAKVHYTIEFENDTAFAQASAHTIVIRDTLDSRYFDLKSFLPTSVKIGERETFLDETEDVKTVGGVTSFLKTIDMRPEINAIAQVEGEYNQQTGIAKWTFTSLDPMTMEPTDDLMQGILPVNYNGTSGIGEVMFEVGVKPNKADGTQIPNRASIVFDYEEPILTPIWTNIVDATAPESCVADVQLLNDSTATVSIEATDELSGPWRYDVYVQYGSGAWFKAAENVPADTTANVKVYEGIDHGFYVVVTDSAGNVEQKEAAREFSLSYNAATTVTGDVNGDEAVNGGDVMAVYNSMAGGATNSRSDVNGDGAVNGGDVMAVYDIMAGGKGSVRAFYRKQRKANNIRQRHTNVKQ